MDKSEGYKGIYEQSDGMINTQYLVLRLFIGHKSERLVPERCRAVDSGTKSSLTMTQVPQTLGSAQGA